MSIPKVSVIILNYNGEQFLEDCFASLKQNTLYPNYEVLMVDNNSTDDSVIFTKKIPWINIIEVNTNRGFAAGNNVGIQKTNSDYVVLLNTDTVVQPYWLSKMVETAESDCNIGVVGAIPVHMDMFNLYSRPSHFDRVEDVSQVAGAAMLIKRAVLNKVGLLDEYSFLYWEDTEFCWRTYLTGYKVVYDYDAVIYHHVGGSSGKTKWVYEKKKNELYTYLKLLDFPYSIYFSTIASIKGIGLVLINPKSTNSILRAFLSTLKNYNQIIQQRTGFKTIKRRNTRDLVLLIKKPRNYKKEIEIMVKRINKLTY